MGMFWSHQKKPTQFFPLIKHKNLHPSPRPPSNFTWRSRFYQPPPIKRPTNNRPPITMTGDVMLPSDTTALRLQILESCHHFWYGALELLLSRISHGGIDFTTGIGFPSRRSEGKKNWNHLRTITHRSGTYPFPHDPPTTSASPSFASGRRKEEIICYSLSIFHTRRQGFDLHIRLVGLTTRRDKELDEVWCVAVVM